jgi:hypothetical protein
MQFHHRKRRKREIGGGRGVRASKMCKEAETFETALDLFTFKIDYLETNMQKHNESKQRALKVITMIR